MGKKKNAGSNGNPSRKDKEKAPASGALDRPGHEDESVPSGSLPHRTLLVSANATILYTWNQGHLGSLV